MGGIRKTHLRVLYQGTTSQLAEKLETEGGGRFNPRIMPTKSREASAPEVASLRPTSKSRLFRLCQNPPQKLENHLRGEAAYRPSPVGCKACHPERVRRSGRVESPPAAADDEGSAVAFRSSHQQLPSAPCVRARLSAVADAAIPPQKPEKPSTRRSRERTQPYLQGAPGPSSAAAEGPGIEGTTVPIARGVQSLSS